MCVCVCEFVSLCKANAQTPYYYFHLYFCIKYTCLQSNAHVWLRQGPDNNGFDTIISLSEEEALLKFKENVYYSIISDQNKKERFS